jgi:hypothetical protein
VGAGGRTADRGLAGMGARGRPHARVAAAGSAGPRVRALVRGGGRAPGRDAAGPGARRWRGEGPSAPGRRATGDDSLDPRDHADPGRVLRLDRSRRTAREPLRGPPVVSGPPGPLDGAPRRRHGAPGARRPADPDSGRDPSRARGGRCGGRRPGSGVDPGRSRLDGRGGGGSGHRPRGRAPVAPARARGRRVRARGASGVAGPPFPGLGGRLAGRRAGRRGRHPLSGRGDVAGRRRARLPVRRRGPERRSAVSAAARRVASRVADRHPSRPGPRGRRGERPQRTGRGPAGKSDGGRRRAGLARAPGDDEGRPAARGHAPCRAAATTRIRVDRRAASASRLGAGRSLRRPATVQRIVGRAPHERRAVQAPADRGSGGAGGEGAGRAARRLAPGGAPPRWPPWQPALFERVLPGAGSATGGGRVGRSRQPSRPPAPGRAGPPRRRPSARLAHRSTGSRLRSMRAQRLATVDPRLLSSEPPCKEL